jgi:hypothetical protein
MATLMEGMAAVAPADIDAAVPDDTEPNPVATLKAQTLRRLYKQMAFLGLEQSLVETIAVMVVASLHPVFDAPGTSLEDKTAACVVAERVALATLFGLSHGVLRRSLEGSAE